VGGVDPSIERIVALKPDLVLLPASSRAIPRLRELGVTVFGVDLKTLADLHRTLLNVGRLLQVPGAPLVWDRIERGIAGAARRLPPDVRGTTVYFEVSNGPYAASESSHIGELLAALGERTPAPASGAATALTGALAAALTELAARYAGDGAAVEAARAAGARLVELADEDAAAYTAFMAERSPGARARIVAVPEEIAAHGDEVAALAEGVLGALRSSVAGDAEAAIELARASARVARRLAELNRG
jgi:hypothetical protein